MRRLIMYSGAMVAAALAASLVGSPAAAQVPAPTALDCVCLRINADALAADLAAKRQAYDGMQSEIGQIDSQLDAERSRMDINNPAGISPEATARFRQLLERRDMLFQQSNGPAFGALSEATNRYGARSQEFNIRCTGRPMDPGLLAQAQATHACPPPW
ncbi:MAG: hypothetical protein JO058_11485 [Alphaproteobacteria bacterium]|nr:hypothetical protein [Alphaproteobacteria bacterium]